MFGKCATICYLLVPFKWIEAQQLLNYYMKSLHFQVIFEYTGELGYDRLNGTRKIGMSYAKSVVYI